MTKGLKFVLATSTCLAAIAWCGPAMAQESAPLSEEAATRGDEIIVTATKRETNLQETPISISAFDYDYLERNNARTFAQIADSIPNLRAPDGLNGLSNVSIRGISSPSRQGAGVEQPVGTYLDQVFAGSGVLGTQLFDIQQIEVIRGPQGTLFGRNTAAGAISFTSRRPSWHTEGYAEAEIGTYDLRAVRGAISMPVVDDKIAVRIAAAHHERDGYTRRVSGGSLGKENADAVRLSLLVEPTDRLRLTLIGSYAVDEGTQSVGFFTSGPVEFTLGNNGRKRVADINDEGRFQSKLATLTGILDYDVSGYRISAISGYRHQQSFSSFDEDMTVQDLFVNRAGQLEGPNKDEQFSQELRLTSPTGGVFDFTTGLYYYSVKSRSNQIDDYGDQLTAIFVDAGILPPFIRSFEELSLVRSSTKAYAWYGQANVHPTDALTLLGGFRLNREIKTFGSDRSGFRAFGHDGSLLVDEPSGPIVFLDKFKDGVLTPMVGMQYEVSSDVMGYATYSQGYKSGGFNTASGRNAAINPFFGVETAKNYEIGLRSTWFDRRLTANATLFWLDYSDLQTQQFVGIDSQVVNAGRARSRGAEVQLNAIPLPGWRIDWGLGYTDAKYLDFQIRNATTGEVVSDFAGNRLPFAPRWTSSLSTRYDVDVRSLGTLSLQGEWSYSSSYFQELTNDPFGREDGYSLFHARAAFTLPNESWQLAFWGRNLTNALVRTDFNGQLPAAIFQGARFQAYGAPRTYGIELRARF